MDVSQLEPAERNFKREITTLIVILVIAFGAGGVILAKYIKMRERQNKEVAEGRAPEIGELVKNFSFKNRDDEKASFFDCTGQVTLMACFSANQLEDSELIIETLKTFDEKYANEPRVRILLLSLDSEEDMPADKVMPILEKAGMAGSKWQVAMSNGDPFLAYVKKQLKFIHLAKKKREGRWIVPQRIRVMGPNLKLRGRESEYDFAKILADQEVARRELKDNPEFLKDERFKGNVENIDLVAHARGVMAKSIGWMLTNEEFDKVKIDTSKKENIYKPYLWVFGGFVLFLAILWLKVKRKQKYSNK